MRVWRIVRRSRLEDTEWFGPPPMKMRRNLNRWNPQGVAAVYASESIEDAVAEKRRLDARPDEEFAAKYVAVSLEIPDSLVEVVDAASLPDGWKNEAPNPFSQLWGLEWLKGAQFVAARLPSARDTKAHVYLINPALMAAHDLQPDPEWTSLTASKNMASLSRRSDSEPL